jgi:hypothetical protein
VRTFFFSISRRIRLFRGQRVLLVCGRIIRRIIRVRLRRGEFIRVTCSVTGNTITVSCGTPRISRGTLRLGRGDSVIVRCRTIL